MKPTLLLLLFFFSLVFSSSSAAPKSLQLLSLLSLKTSLKDPLSSLTDWNASTTVVNSSFSKPLWCSWSGVECHNKTSEITSLDLSHRSLSGSIPHEIGFLSQLRYLNLSGNAFDGPLSSSIFELSQLKSLDISHNNFNGSFPPGLSKLKFLTVFNAYSNSFNGPLPHEVTRLPFLERLNLGGSFFDGSIPASYGSIPRLKYLHLSGNSLQGPIPPELGFLNQLEHLEIGYNVFNGGIPVELGSLSNLTYLDVSFANLTGVLPSEIGNLSALESLFLFKNRFSGEIPVSFSKLIALKTLDLSDNRLTGRIPEGFSSLKELTLLSLLSNNLTGEIPEGIGELPNLETLLLWNNSLTGNLPRNLGSNSKLQKLDVSSNSLTGPIPPSLCLGNRLVRLILFSNRFDSQIPPSLAKCTSLWRFRIEDNRFNGSIPSGFGFLPNLTYMDLSMNNFSGTIPRDFGNAIRLEFLNVSENAFGTELPDNIWKAPNLQIFSASYSKLTGKIPDFVGCKSLYKLELEGNSFNGSIPWDIGHCEKLLCLNLRKNSLTGIIPWELSTLPSITDVDLSQNLLTGSIPSDFDNCSTLESFNVSFNLLTGPIPSSGNIFPNLHPSSFSGNEALCGKVLNKPCLSDKINNTDENSVRFRHEPKKTSGATAIVWIMAVAFGIGIFILIAGSRCFHANYSRRFSTDDHHKKAGPWKLTAFQRLNYTVDDVLECLSTSDKIIGMGSTGTVYKAEMPGGEIIAVKKLWGKQKETVRRRRGVLAEVEVLGNVRHRNIVRLLGCCSNNESTLLLYEYMPNGSLDDLLHGKNKGENLVADWVIRYKIALGVAQGICYLHHDCDPVIVHRDVKPCNILLDAEMEARVADFGVAKLIQTDESMSVIAGSCGYIAPEYAYTLQVDEKSDIYSYGVVLMEILSGKKSVDAEFGEGNSIVDWIRSKIKTKDGVSDVLDKNAGASCTSVKEEMMLVLRVALLCTSRNPADRPSMRDVVSMLHEAKPQRKIPGSLSGGGGSDNNGGAVGGGVTPLAQKLGM
ncbi:Protein kinase domain [Macleaya cordata]|uniref:non-specific serine/threonine protein kinase n=1 Tax=Macleaya cordata TaxID=56857 RepID=A0A200PVB0_MACCD|nr:Protein kinase domain [Macleaya cordata]